MSLSPLEREQLAANRHVWDCWAPLHLTSKFYSVEDFIAGGSSLRSIETSELGDVLDKRLLHLQCHFGLDTLSWARLGADAVGVDNSEVAIDIARRLSVDTGIQADFVCSDLYALPGPLDRDSFDIVFSSYGVLSWLPDLEPWASVSAALLKPGGVFYLVEFHPLLDMLDEDTGTRFEFPYFGADRKPLVLRDEVSYADPDADQPSHTLYQWIHSLGDVVSALAGAGLTIEWLHEFDYSPYACYPWLHERRHNEYVADFPAAPHVFSVKARKPVR
ncbi:class I SAM-dependent methyltransferase [Mycobacterium sp.]|jgi:SAM-dependent methyltransferase|uniref:class I SAM-dependent methyltransferase n=1 Tax=Mycobacterium sp. TaxID=1785 RepID=UPI002B7F4D66|nr:class I SAM-dependent methyltransferase [Mycobacterium sp.]HTH84632.1 class I SAM-dependent methyltransferase [Mycobacterium sp.]